MNRRFSSKLLLFGEYSVLHGSDACAFPFPEFSGILSATAGKHPQGSTLQDSNRSLHQLWEYLKEPSRVEKSAVILDLKKFGKDLSNGLWFDSDIPLHYGLGSSGALVAAVYDRYKLSKPAAGLAGLKENLAMIESFFHSRSSGTDPLVSYLDQPVVISAKGIETGGTDLGTLRKFIRIDLVDSGVPGKTKTGVSGFEKEFLGSEEIRRVYESEYIPLVNNIIDRLKQADGHELFDDCLKLSRYQTKLFARLFTGEMLELALAGIAGGTEAIKLCGSGGGGYFIRIRPAQGV